MVLVNEQWEDVQNLQDLQDISEIIRRQMRIVKTKRVLIGLFFFTPFSKKKPF